MWCDRKFRNKQIRPDAVIAVGSPGETIGIKGANPIEFPNTPKGRLTLNAFSRIQAKTSSLKTTEVRAAHPPGADEDPEEKQVRLGGQACALSSSAQTGGLLTVSGHNFRPF